MAADVHTAPWGIARVYELVRLALLLGIVIYLGWEIVVGWSEVRALEFTFDGSLLFGAAVSGLIAYQCLFCGWLILLWKAGYFNRGDLGQYCRIWWVSYLFRYIPGKLMLLVERARMGSTVGIPPTAGAALAIIETIFAMVGAGWVSVLTLSYYIGNPTWLLWAVGGVSLAILVLLPMGYQRLSTLAWVETKFPELRSLTVSSGAVLLAMPAFVLFYLFMGLSFFLGINSIQEFSWSAWPGLCGVYALSHLMGLLILIAPGGLGVREGALSLQLSTILAQGVAEITALGARIWFTGIELFSFGLVLLFTKNMPRSSKDQDVSSQK